MLGPLREERDSLQAQLSALSSDTRSVEEERDRWKERCHRLVETAQRMDPEQYRLVWCVPVSGLAVAPFHTSSHPSSPSFEVAKLWRVHHECYSNTTTEQIHCLDLTVIVAVSSLVLVGIVN